MHPTEQAILTAVQQANNILVITHIGPDGDAVGSITAVGVALRQMGKHATLLCDDPLPERFSYLPLADQVQPPNENRSTDYDLLIAVDCGDETRMGQSFANLPDTVPTIINIDHHVTNTYFGDIQHVVPEAVSATEILYDLFKHIGLTITTDLAMCLLTGVVTDTLGFRTVGVTAKTLRIASELVDAGADLPLINMQGLSLKPFSTAQLWQIGLNNMRLEDGLIWTKINNTQREAIGYNNTSTGGLVNFLGNVTQAAISAVLLEMNDGTVRVGFRCNPPYSVSELALNLGGGGHPLAAGCSLDGPLDKAEALVVAMSKETIRQQQASFSED
ncbi:MAG: bifunctional oligoribonuclease/PAP phosphatase NrnA [Ardenticatenaceae bacterium]|nr:bifunctional oligoribonuclease/PAP phosphatase NrnA [Ardenticatenaceae bacterium]